VAGTKSHGRTMNFVSYGNRRTKQLIGLVPLRTGTNIARHEELLRKHFDAINEKTGVTSAHVQKVFTNLQDCIKS